MFTYNHGCVKSIFYRTRQCEKKTLVTRGGEVSSRETLERIHHNDESTRKKGLCGDSGTRISIAVPILGGSQILCIQLYSDEEKIRRLMIFL